MKALQGVIPTWWTPPTEEGSTNPTRFKIRPLTGIEAHEVLGECLGLENGDLLIPTAAARRAIDYAVIGVDNFEGYNPNAPILDQLPDFVVVRSLAQRIVTDCILRIEEKKAYGSPSPSPGNQSISGADRANGATDAPIGSAIPNGPDPLADRGLPNGD